MYEKLNWMAEPMMGDRRKICPFENENHVPFVMREPLSAANVAPYLNSGTLVTFSGQVPLGVIEASGVAGIEGYIKKNWFSAPVQLSKAKYRAIGAAFDTFGTEVTGLVHLQVICELHGS